MARAITVPEIIIYVILIGVLGATGIILAIRRTKVKSNNLEFLIAFFFGAASTALFFALDSDDVLIDKVLEIIFCTSAFLSGCFLLVFTERTFFIGKKSPIFTLFLIIYTMLIIYIMQQILDPYVGQALTPFTPAWAMGLFKNFLFAITMSVPGYWFGYLALKQYRSIKKENIEPWIKKRFLIVGICAILFGSVGWQSYMIALSTIPAIDPTAILRLLSLLITVLIMITFSIGSFIAWVMPEGMKQYFNRKYKPTDGEELSEEAIMKQMGGD